MPTQSPRFLQSLPLMALLLAGCGFVNPDAPPVAQGRPAAKGQRAGDAGGARGAPGQAPELEGLPQLPVAEDDEQPLEANPGPRGRNPLVRGLQDLMQSAPLGDAADDLAGSLQQADDTLSQIKDENARAIRELNRQVQLPVQVRGAPHLVVVLADGLGTEHLSCFGGAAQTPQIDALAAEGARCESFYAAGTTAQASFWSMLTGRDSSQAHVGNGPAYVLASGQATLAEMMWQAGYQTAFVGHWPLAEPGRLRGFDEWLGEVGEDPFFPASLRSGESKIAVPDNANGAQVQFADKLYIQEALSFLERRDRSRPFLLIVSLVGPAAAEALGAGDITREMVEQLDSNVGLLRQRLDELQLGSRTALWVTSVRSPQAAGLEVEGAGRRSEPGTLYDGNLRVPLVVAWPGRFKAGTLLSDPFGMWDLMPTFGHLASAQRRPQGMDGVSMRGALTGRPGPPQGRLLYWESRDGGYAQAARMGEWKVVRPAGQVGRESVELYNLEDDPGERHNVAAEHADIVAAFLK